MRICLPPFAAGFRISALSDRQDEDDDELGGG
jgi:hypothetical protein